MTVRIITCNKSSLFRGPSDVDGSLVRKIVSPLKDVEGLHFKFHYNLYHKCVCRLHR